MSFQLHILVLKGEVKQKREMLSVTFHTKRRASTSHQFHVVAAKLFPPLFGQRVFKVPLQSYIHLL